jgi:hypothetical protein
MHWHEKTEFHINEHKQTALSYSSTSLMSLHQMHKLKSWLNAASLTNLKEGGENKRGKKLDACNKV